MTINSRIPLRLVACLLTVMVLLSCFPGMLSQHTRAEGETGITVGDFRLNLISGAEKDAQDRYVFRTYNRYSGHRFRFRLTYSFSGVGNIPAGGVDITLPYTVLHDRNGLHADRFEISLSAIGDTGNRQDFAYRIVDGDVVHITNTHQISAAQNGYVKFAYVASKDSYSYQDMAPSLSCQANLTITRNGSSLQQQSQSYVLYIDSYAKARLSHVVSPETFYQEWQESWGEKPADADDYYYMIWTVGTYINATQPYCFHLDNLRFPENEGCSVVGFEYEEEKKNDPDHDHFSLERESDPVLTREGYRFDYVLTRHAKEIYEPLEQYSLILYADSVVVPNDGIDASTTQTSGAEYIYDTPVFVSPHGSWNAWIFGTTSWRTHFNYDWPIADYRLQEFKDGVISSISGDLKYCLYAVASPYLLTVEKAPTKMTGQTTERFP